MQQFQIPCFQLADSTRWKELPEWFEGARLAYEKQFGQPPPLLLFEPYEESQAPKGRRPIPSEAPEELIVAPIHPLARTAVFEALARVEAREPTPPPGHIAKMPDIKPKTTLKNFFRQMGDMPATVLSLTFPNDGPDPMTIFFLRSAFTISEFRREVARTI